MGKLTVQAKYRTPQRASHARHAADRSNRSLAHSAGNLAIQSHRQRISQPHDPLEHRAGRLAEQALRNTNPVADAAYGHKPAQAEASVGGQSLPYSQRRYFEARFGQDFSAVRIHDDSQAHQAASAINAKAFTLGNHIRFDKGQYAPHTAPGRRLLAHELAHVSQPDNDPNTAYRESWDVNDSNRTIQRNVLVQLIFKNTWSDWYNNTGWTDARKRSFSVDFEQGIENRFNNSGIVINPHSSMSDVLPAESMSKGYDPKVDISLVPDGESSVSEDWEVDVESNPGGGWRQPSSNRNYGELNESSNKPFTLASSASGVQQNQAVHEFGHFIGLDHPGKGLGGNWFSKSKLSPGASEYGHTGTDAKGRTVDGPNDLMGGGMGMQPFYFDAWVEQLSKHVEALRRSAARRRFNDEIRAAKRAIGGDPASIGWLRRGFTNGF